MTDNFFPQLIHCSSTSSLSSAKSGVCDFIASFQGPKVTTSPPYNPVDQIGDGDVDLPDAAMM